jgi:hypothetical protein
MERLPPGYLPLRVLLLTVAFASLAPAGAQAHTLFMSPKPRDQMDGYKPTRTPGFVMPCGVARSAAQPTTTLPAGAMQMIQWKETVPHPGCFLIEFAKSDTDQFQRLAVEPHPAAMVANKAYAKMIQLPDQPCTSCILRIRQYMANSNPCPPADLKDGDANLYYSCANITLDQGVGGTGDASAPDARTADTGAAGSGGSGGSAGTGGSGGYGGTGGVAGTGGNGGSTTGGTGGSVSTAGTGGSVSTGGTGAGAAGSGGATGGAGGQPTSKGALYGGCSVAAGSHPGAIVLLFVAGVVLSRTARRRRAR